MHTSTAMNAATFPNQLAGQRTEAHCVRGDNLGLYAKIGTNPRLP